MIAKMHLAYNKAMQAVRNNKGQNTIEYMMMLAVIVVVIGLVIAGVRALMPELFDNIKEKLLGQVNTS